MRRGGVLILVLGLLLIVAAGGLFLFMQPTNGTSSSAGGPTALPTEDPGVDVVRAKIDIEANSLISDTFTLLELTNIPTAEYNADIYFTAVEDVADKLTTRKILAGTLIEKDMLAEPGLSQRIPTAEPERARDKAYPLIVNNLSGVGDQIIAGDFVDVVATFTFERRRSYPTGQRIEEQGGQNVVTVDRELTDITASSTKTIVQRAKVLQILRPEVPAADSAEGTPPPAGTDGSENASVPEVDASGQPINANDTATERSSITQGLWTLMLALNDQEVELIEFAQATDARIVLVLRGAGDSGFEPTIGVTLDLLVSEFGVPLPEPVQPYVYSEDVVFTGVPTRTPAPTRVP